MSAELPGLEFHHFFVFVPEGAPPVELLREQGFSEGSRNSHPGQGTANRRLFFQNGMLEFFWVNDPVEVRSPLAAPTRLWERSQYRASGFSPFGIGLCPAAGPKNAVAEPFPGWRYCPRYLPPGHSIWVAANDDCPWEPMIFYLSFVNPFAMEAARKEPVDHANGATHIDRISVTLMNPAQPLSAAARMLDPISRIRLEAGTRSFAEVQLVATEEREIDLSPWCPMRIVLKRA